MLADAPATFAIQVARSAHRWTLRPIAAPISTIFVDG
jgi:hypothetical protein